MTKAKRKTPLKDLPPIDSSLNLVQGTAAIASLLNTETDSIWKIGGYYATLVDNKVPLPDKLVHLEDYLRTQIKNAPAGRTFRLYADLYRHFSEPVTLKYGPTKLELLIRLAMALHLDLPADPGSMPIDVPGQDGQLHQKAFADCTEDDLGHALHHPQPNEPLPKGLTTAIASFAKAMQGMGKVTVVFKQGNPSLMISDLPLGNKGQLQNAVLELKSAVGECDDWSWTSARNAPPPKRRDRRSAPGRERI